MLTTMGMTDWIAETEEQYVQIAVEKASNVAELATLRAGLRERFLTSILGDNVAYCQAVEQEYTNMWRKYIESREV